MSSVDGVNALSGLYLISTVPLQKPRFYAVSRTCFHLMIKCVHAVKEELRQFSRPLRGIGAVHFAFR